MLIDSRINDSKMKRSRIEYCVHVENYFEPCVYLRAVDHLSATRKVAKAVSFSALMYLLRCAPATNRDC